MLIKLSIMLLYLRTFAVSSKFRWTMWVLIFILVSTHITHWFVYWLSNTPLDCAWKAYPDVQAPLVCYERFDPGDYIIFIPVLNIIMDIIILIMPCPYVLRLQLPKRQKIIILGIILAGVMYADPLHDEQLHSC